MPERASGSRRSRNWVSRGCESPGRLGRGTLPVLSSLTGLCRAYCVRQGRDRADTPPTLLEFPVQQGGTQTDRGVGQAPQRKAGVLTAVMDGSLPWSCRLHLLAGPAPAWVAVGVGWAGLASGKSIPGVPKRAMCKERPGTDSAPCPPTSSAISSILGT